MNGWVKLHRKILDNPIWTSEPFTRGQAFVDLVMMANTKEADLVYGNMTIHLKRGQLHTSEIKLSQRWGWSRKKVRSFLGQLKGQHMVTTKGTTMGTTLTIENYGVYQDKGTTEDTTKDTTEDTTKGTQTRSKEDKENICGQMFDEFWQIYPKKKAKETAYKSWLKIKPSKELHTQIINKVTAYKQSEDWKKDNGRFIPYPATWLNQHRWEDEIETKPEAKDNRKWL